MVVETSRGRAASGASEPASGRMWNLTMTVSEIKGNAESAPQPFHPHRDVFWGWTGQRGHIPPICAQFLGLVHSLDHQISEEISLIS